MADRPEHSREFIDAVSNIRKLRREVGEYHKDPLAAITEIIEDPDYPLDLKLEAALFLSGLTISRLLKAFELRVVK